MSYLGPILLYVPILVLATAVLIGYRRHREMIDAYDARREAERRAERAQRLDDVEESLATISVRTWDQ